MRLLNSALVLSLMLVANSQAATSQERIEFDALGRKTAIIYPGGNRVDMDYDMVSRMLSRTYKRADGTIESTDTFTYDNASRVLTATNACSKISYTYDEIGRRNSMTQTIDGVSKTVNFAYDVANRLISRSIVEGATETRTYTKRNQLETVSLDGVLVASFSYDAAGREISRASGNGVLATNSYARADNLITSVDLANKPELSFAYNYDSNKNVTAEIRGGSMATCSWNAAFDNMDRITSQNDATQTRTWSRDLVGNTTSESLDGTSQARTLNGFHAPVGAGDKTFEYNRNGQMTHKNDLALTWDARNLLVSSSDNAHPEVGATQYRYDALGNRISKGGTRYIVVDGQVIAEITGNELKQFVHGSYIDDVVAQKSVAALQYFHKNRQFNTAGLTDTSGNVIEFYAIDATGHIKAFDGLGIVKPAPTATDRLFTGHVFDKETGLHYFRARYFEPELGTFVSKDLLGHVDGYSLYQGWFAFYLERDSSGQRRETAEEMAQRAQREYDAWVQKEIAKGPWWLTLPKCPCQLEAVYKTTYYGWGACGVGGGGSYTYLDGYKNPDDKIWKDPKAPRQQEESLHPGAAYSMRSIPDADGHSNQCIYDKNGKLVTTPPTAGTVDWQQSLRDGHYPLDVAPVILANILDGGDVINMMPFQWNPGHLKNPPGPNVLRYFLVRPSYHDNCPKKPLNIRS